MKKGSCHYVMKDLIILLRFFYSPSLQWVENVFVTTSWLLQPTGLKELHCDHFTKSRIVPEIVRWQMEILYVLFVIFRSTFLEREAKVWVEMSFLPWKYFLYFFLIHGVMVITMTRWYRMQSSCLSLWKFFGSLLHNVFGFQPWGLQLSHCFCRASHPSRYPSIKRRPSQTCQEGFSQSWQELKYFHIL